MPLSLSLESYDRGIFIISRFSVVLFSACHVVVLVVVVRLAPRVCRCASLVLSEYDTRKLTGYLLITTFIEEEEAQQRAISTYVVCT